MIRRIVLAAFCGMFLFNLNAVALEWGGGTFDGGGASSSWGDDGVNCNNYAPCTGHNNAKKCARISTDSGCMTGVVSCKKGYNAKGALGEIADIGTVYLACIVEVPADLGGTPPKKTTASTPAPAAKKTITSTPTPAKETTVSVRAATGTCAKSATRDAYMDEYLWVDSAGYEFCATDGLRPASEANKKCYDCNNPGTKSKIKGCEVKNPGDKIWLSFGGAVGSSTTQGADSFVFECTNENHGDTQTSHKWKALPVLKVCLDVGNNTKVSVPKYESGKLKNVEIYYNVGRSEYCQELPEEKNLYSVTISGDNSQVIISEQNASRLKIKRAWTRLNAMSDDFKVSVWRDKQGNFNTARLASDSIAAVVLGTTGALVTSNIVKKNQVSGGFEDVQCTIGGQVVATWGDDFSVGIQ